VVLRGSALSVAILFAKGGSDGILKLSRCVQVDRDEGEGRVEWRVVCSGDEAEYKP
jgi:hypothetical protein